MRFEKGRWRLVFVFPAMGIAVKIPIIRAITFCRIFIRDVFHFRLKLIYQQLMWPIEVPLGIKPCLLAGIVSNWSEFWFFLRTRHPFLQPTYFSLFGLLNVQKAGEPCNMKTEDVWCQLSRMTDRRVWDDNHHFENPKNFCFSGGKFRMLDYGNRRTHKVVKEYGHKILANFDPNYNWEEVKKALMAAEE